MQDMIYMFWLLPGNQLLFIFICINEFTSFFVQTFQVDKYFNMKRHRAL